MGATVIRNGLILRGTLPSGTGDLLLTIDSTTKEVGTVPPIDTSTFITNSLTSGNLLVGNSSNIATARQITGAISISNLGVASISNDVITDSNIFSAANIAYSKLNLVDSIDNDDISVAAAISRSKLATGSVNRILINNGVGVVTDASAITASRILISDVNGIPTHSAIAASAITFLDATSSIQTQLNDKLAFSSAITPATGDVIYYDSGVWTNLGIGASGEVLTVSGGGIPEWAGPTGSGFLPTGGSANQYLRKIDATDFNTEWDTLALSDISDITANITQINALATGFYDATSSVQDQLDSKLDTSLTTDNVYVGVAGVATEGTNLPTGITIGSQYIYRTGGTDVTLADGGTGASLADPGADRILFWDDSAGQVTWLTVGTNLSITGTTISAAGSLTNSAANNELMKSNGTNAVASGLFSTADGNITLGTGLSGSIRTILADDVSSSCNLVLQGKGSGTIQCNNFLTVNGIATSGITHSSAATNSVIQALTLSGLSTGSPANGIGTGLQFVTETSISNIEIGATIEAVCTDVSTAIGASEDFDLVFRTMAGGASASERLRVNGTAITIANTVAETGTPVANSISIFSVDDSAETILGLNCEKAVASDAALVSTHSLLVKINGTVYKLPLVTP